MGKGDNPEQAEWSRSEKKGCVVFSRIFEITQRVDSMFPKNRVKNKETHSLHLRTHILLGQSLIKRGTQTTKEREGGSGSEKEEPWILEVL